MDPGLEDPPLHRKSHQQFPAAMAGNESSMVARRSKHSVRSIKRILQRRKGYCESRIKGEPSLCGFGEGQGRYLRFWSGYPRTPRRRGSGTFGKLSWELERPSLALIMRRSGAHLVITGAPGKYHSGQEGVGGGHSSDDGKDNTTSPERRTPASSMHCVTERNADEC